MIEVLSNPITLLCLGVVFLLIALLFFYFKRSLSLLERAQMEQARVLQSFITNMEMSQHQQMARQHQMMTQTHVSNNLKKTEHNSGQPLPLIDVSDDGNATNDDSDSDSDDNDSDSDDSDSDDSDNNSVENDSKNDTNHKIILHKIPIIEVDAIQNEEDNIKVIELQESSLEEIYPEIMNIDKLNDSDDEDDEDDNDDEDDDSEDDINNNSDNDSDNEIDRVKPETILLVENEKNVEKININKQETNSSIIHTDLKTLNVQTLRKMAEEAHLIEAGEKKTKKELITLLSNK